MAPTSVLVLADLAVKGLVVLAVTTIAAHGLRCRSAATVHRIWLLGLAVLLAVPRRACSYRGVRSK